MFLLLLVPGAALAQTRSAVTVDATTWAAEDVQTGGDEDYDDFVVDYNVRCVIDDATEDLVSEEIRFVTRTAGANYTNSFVLQVPNLPQTVTISDDGGATSTPLCDGDCGAEVVLIPDVDDGFVPRGTGFVNTEGPATFAGKVYVVRLDYPTGTPAAIEGVSLACAVPDFAIDRPDLASPIDADTTIGLGQPLAGNLPHFCPPPDPCLPEERVPWAAPLEQVGIAEPGAYGTRFLSWLADLTDGTPCVGEACADADWYMYPGAETIDAVALAATTPLPPAPTCDDGLPNGDEVDVDCGGDVCAPCLPIRVNVDWTDAVVGGAYQPSLSADGRYVAFTTGYNRPGLVSGHFNLWGDAYVRDTHTGTTTLVSVALGGGAADFGAASAAISADGRYVAWQSGAGNLVIGDTNGKNDIFVRDLQTGVTEIVSVSSAGDVGNEESWGPSISGDGRYVVFSSKATNLVTTDANGAAYDIFRHDRQTGETVLVNVNDAGVQGDSGFRTRPVISPDGRYVAFSSNATNLVPGDTNGVIDSFRRDMVDGTTIRVSLADDESQCATQCVDPVMSADGNVFVFRSTSALAAGANGSNLLFVRDVTVGTTTIASVSTGGVVGVGDNLNPTISADGRFVAFQSKATNLAGPTPTTFQDNVYLRDRVAGTTVRISVPWDGVESTQTNAGSRYAALAGDGATLAFSGSNPTLVPGDSYVGDGNYDDDVFLLRLGAAAPTP